MHHAFLLSILLILSTGCCREGGCWWGNFITPSLRDYVPEDVADDRFIDTDFERVTPQTIVDVDQLIYMINFYAVTVEEEHKHRVVLEDSRIFYDEFHINKIWLKFITQDIAELWDARKLLTDIVEGYLNVLNNDPELSFFAPSLDGTFTADNIDVSVLYESFMGKYIDPLYVNTTILQDGDVYYYAYDVYNPNTDIWHQQYEPYHKTLLLVGARSTAQQPYWQKKQGAMEKSTLSNILIKSNNPAPQEFPYKAPSKPASNTILKQ